MTTVQNIYRNFQQAATHSKSRPQIEIELYSPSKQQKRVEKAIHHFVRGSKGQPATFRVLVFPNPKCTTRHWKNIWPWSLLVSLLNAFSNESRWKHYGNKPVGGPEIEYLSAHLTEMQSYWFLLYSCWLPATALPSDPKIPSAVLSNSWWESGTTTLLNQTCVSWHTKNGNVQCWNCIWIRISR